MRLPSSSCSWKNAIQLSQQCCHGRWHPQSIERRSFLLLCSSSPYCSSSTSCRPLSSQYHSSIIRTSTRNVTNEQIRHYRYSKTDNSAKLRALRNKNNTNTQGINKEDVEKTIDYRYRDSLSSATVSSTASPQVQPSLSSIMQDEDDDYHEGDDEDSDYGDDMIIMDVKNSDELKSLWGEAAFQAEKQRLQKRHQQQKQKVNQLKNKNKMKNNLTHNNRKGRRNSDDNRNGMNGSKNNFNLPKTPLSPNPVAFKPLFEEIDEIMGKRKASVIRKKKDHLNDNSFSASMNSFFDGMMIDKQQQQQQQQQRTRRILKQNDANYNDNQNGRTGRIRGNDNDSDSDKSDKETKTKSIFDTFRIIDKRKSDIDKRYNENRFDSYCYEQYQTIMSEIVHSDRFRRKHTKKAYEDEVLQPVIDWLLKDEPFVPYDYPILREAVENGIASSCNDSVNEKGFTKGGNPNNTDMPREKKLTKNAFRDAVTQKGSQSQQFLDQLLQQKQDFLEKSSLTSEQYEHAVRAFNILSSNCAKIGSTSSLSVAWEKMKEGGIIPGADAMSAYLYVSGMMTSSGIFRISSLNETSNPTAPATTISRKNNHLGSVLNILGTVNNPEANDDNDNDNDQDNDNAQNKYMPQRIDLPTEMAIFHDLLFEPTEKSITLRVKRLVSQGNAAEAEELLNSFPSINDDAKLRTYLPVLKLYCEQRNLNSALKLYKKMRNEPSVKLEPENYVLLISAFAENGYFRSDKNTKQVECALELGYNHTSGPELFDELLSEMSDDILEISSASARRLYNAIAEGFQDDEDNTKEQNSKLKPIHTLGGLVTDNDKARPDELIASRVAVGATSGICPCSGVKLQLINLESGQRRQLHKGLLQLSNSRFHEYLASEVSNVSASLPDDYASKHLNSYAQWLDSREGKPFTAIIDGANVAYYMQNFEGGSFNFHQIKFMVEALEKMNENPLVILPHKYFRPKFQISSTNRYHIVKEDEKKILDDLTKKGQLYHVPPRCLDDYYWMLASVSDQTRSRNDADLDVSIDNEEGRWPGARPMLISNDQMRDHKLGLLEPRLFRRWYSCYIVNYNFTAFVGQQSIDREIGFSTADFFSREIQANDTDSGKVWHIPVNDWKLDDRFCVRIPKM